MKCAQLGVVSCYKLQNCSLQTTTHYELFWCLVGYSRVLHFAPWITWSHQLTDIKFNYITDCSSADQVHNWILWPFSGSMGGHSSRKYGMYQSFQVQNAHECDFNRNPITVIMKISVRTQYLCVQNVLIMLGWDLGKGGNKSRQQDGTGGLNPKTLNPGFFFPVGWWQWRRWKE